MADARMRAPSLWLQYEYKEPGDILMQDIFVPKSGLATYTYYCCLNWNSGQEGGGYCGIQDHPDGRAYIFSIWDSEKANDVPITASYVGPGTKTEPFGGEGTGLKSMNFQLGWKENQWYTMVVRRWDGPPGKTCFGCWVHDQTAEQWTHLVTMEYPVPDIYFSGTTVSFLEDWGFTSEKYRCGHYKNGFKRGKNGKWIPFQKAKFQVNDEKTATMNFDAFRLDPKDGVYIAAGADTKPSVGKTHHFEFDNSCCLCPQKPGIRLSGAQFGEKSVKWELSSNCVPQFCYRVKSDDQEVASAMGEGVKSVSLDIKIESKCILEVEDLLGNITEGTFSVR